MNNEPSKTIDHPEALRLIAQLIDDARRNGATATASIHSHGIGVHGLTLRFEAEPPAREIAAWQLATRAAWDVESFALESEDGAPMRMRTAHVVYRGLQMQIRMVHQVTAVMAVAA